MAEINLTTRKLFYGTDAQRLAQIPAEGMTFLVTDSPGLLLEYTGTGVNLGDWELARSTTNGNQRIETQPGSVWAYGDQATNNADEYSGVGANAGDGLILTTDSRKSNEHVLVVGYDGAVGDVDVNVSQDGVNGVAGVNVKSVFVQDMNVATRDTWVDGTALAPGIYKIISKHRQIEVLQNGAVAASAFLTSYVGAG